MLRTVNCKRKGQEERRDFSENILFIRLLSVQIDVLTVSVMMMNYLLFFRVWKDLLLLIYT